ncbi:MAG TPA: hypothetical protein VGO68_18090 [Pyrinomonadaceae bacterium]|jgi:hypothetical protein|nr:hypothetical protein [Pyrinomonadaceae bacterium]
MAGHSLCLAHTAIVRRRERREQDWANWGLLPPGFIVEPLNGKIYLLDEE